ncbi:hypothetical protein [Limnobacter sp. MED105]|uniref:hypothetical protein n=1 Tax=Limnobacter sp. MED105 TaxID=391597 RepID=UPI000156C61D|nr:hypothetical protein [Limnobacter sp. MED105]EDM84320.1 hypothetical protein LMED105_02118 [Limnobacter sp. MED105]
MGKSSFFGRTTAPVLGIVTGSWTSEFEHEGQVSYCLQTQVYDSLNIHYFHVYTLVPVKGIGIGQFVQINPHLTRGTKASRPLTEAMISETKLNPHQNPFEFLSASTEEQQKAKTALVVSFDVVQMEFKEAVCGLVHLRPDIFVSILESPGLMRLISETFQTPLIPTSSRFSIKDKALAVQARWLVNSHIAAFLQTFCKANRNFCTGWPEGVRASFSGYWEFSKLRPDDERLLEDARELMLLVGQILEVHGFQKVPDFIRTNEKYFLMAALDRRSEY